MQQRAHGQARPSSHLTVDDPTVHAHSVSRETPSLTRTRRHNIPPTVLLLPTAICLGATIATQAILSELAASGVSAAGVKTPTGVVVASVLASLTTAVLL